MNSDVVMVVSVSGVNHMISPRDAPDMKSFNTTVQGLFGYEVPAMFYEISAGEQSSLLTNSDYINMLRLCDFMSLKVIAIGSNFKPQGMTNNTHVQHTISDFYPAKKTSGTRSVLQDQSNLIVSAVTPRKRTHRAIGTYKQTPINDTNEVYTCPTNMYESGGQSKGLQQDIVQGTMVENVQHTAQDHIVPLRKFGYQDHNLDLDSFKRIQEVSSSSWKKHKDKMARGDFYPGAMSSFPVYPIAPEEEEIVLRSANWVSYLTGPGQIFRGGVEEFRHKLVKYAAKIGFRFSYTRNDSRYVKARCKLAAQDHCQWFVDAANSSVTDEVTIKRCNLIHTCKLSMKGNDVKRLGCRILGNLITDAVRSDPAKSPKIIKAEFQRFYGFNISYEKVWRGVEIARANLFGSFEDSFDELRWYSQAITRTNPGSLVFLETSPPDNRFKRFLVSFHASREGFKKCRPILFVDGTFMKTRYKGTLLSATAKDGNNGLFPVALALVDAENNENWAWFLNKLKDHIQHPQQIMYVSDRAGGLMHAFDAVYRSPLHFFCLFHLMKNLRAMYKGRKYSDIFKNTMCKYLSEMAYAPNVNYFEQAKNKFLVKGQAIAHVFLQDLPPEKWAVAFAPEVHRYGELTSNAAESFNNWILPARGLPVTFMIDCIRTQLMKWFSERRAAATKWTGALTQEMEEKWNESKSIGDSWTIIPANNNAVFEVLSAQSCVVNVKAKTCTCYQWQVRGFPCPHAIAVLKRSNWEIRQVIDSCFFTDTYLSVYSVDINPIADTEKHEIIDLNMPDRINPPIQRRVPGRPRKRRFRTTGETRADKFICGRCGEYGYHYWTTCRYALN